MYYFFHSRNNVGILMNKSTSERGLQVVFIYAKRSVPNVRNDTQQNALPNPLCTCMMKHITPMTKHVEIYFKERVFLKDIVDLPSNVI